MTSVPPGAASAPLLALAESSAPTSFADTSTECGPPGHPAIAAAHSHLPLCCLASPLFRSAHVRAHSWLATLVRVARCPARQRAAGTPSPPSPAPPSLMNPDSRASARAAPPCAASGAASGGGRARAVVRAAGRPRPRRGCRAAAGVPLSAPARARSGNTMDSTLDLESKMDERVFNYQIQFILGSIFRASLTTPGAPQKRPARIFSGSGDVCVSRMQ